MATGWIEQGIEQGRESMAREILQRLIEKRFGPLSESALQGLPALSPDQVDELISAVFDAKSLGELGLEN